MYHITACIVTYHNDPFILKKAIDSFLSSCLNVRLYISDNSKNDDLKSLCNNGRIEYTNNGDNLGFGKAHNKVFLKVKGKSHYHLILNPDVSFDGTILEELFYYMSLNKEIGICAPKTLYESGEIQKSCRLLPSPIDLVIRRLKFLPKFLKSRILFHELSFTEYNKIMNVPFLLGSFLFFRNDIFNRLNGFDNRFFMYMEDLDICRRAFLISKVIFYPEVTIYHLYEKGSTKNIKLLFYHIDSMIKYFFKWGWMIDKEKIEINKKVLNQFKT